MGNIEGLDGDIGELDAVIRDYKARVASGEIKPRKTKVRPLPSWSREDGTERALREALPDDQRRAFAFGRVMAWARQTRRHINRHPWLVRLGKVTAEGVLADVQVQYRVHAGEPMPEDALRAVLAAVWPEGVPEAPAECSAPVAAPSKPRTYKRKPAQDTRSYGLVKRVHEHSPL